MILKDLGFDPWFEASNAEMSQEGCGFARVSAVDRGAYRIIDDKRDVSAELSGRLSYNTDSPADLPCVGDWVTAQFYNNDTAAIIHKVFPRKTFLRRKTPGETVDYQMIAANIDTAFIVQSCHFDFNPRRLDRYLVMAADGHVEPVVILTKTDLVSQEELEQKCSVVNSMTNSGVIALSNVSGIGFDGFETMILPGKTYCLMGSSGVGKTTLINRLLGRNAFDTKAVSSSGEGTHATTRRQLIVLDSGAMLIDTPGMRELGIVGATDGVNMGFEAFAGLAGQCRYADCSHEHEPGCAVRAAIEKGELDEDRYLSYIKLKKESEFYGMSYGEKRKKDKAFGKFIKSVKKQMKD